MSNNEPGINIEVLQVNRELANLEDALKELEKEMTGLENRLSPIVFSIPKEDKEDSKKAPILCLFADRLSSYTAITESILSRVQGLLKEIQI